MLQCENEDSPVIRCSSANIDLVMAIVEQAFYLGGFPSIKVRFSKESDMDKVKRKTIGNLCSML
jgi:hypothetical protein